MVCGTSADWNDYLSSVCEKYYGHSPKVNHELLNIECVGAQYKKARNQVIKNLLNENDCTGYMKGTSPEAMVYRAAFVHTKNDEGCNRVCNEIERFLNNVQEKNILLKHYINVCREKIMVQEKESYLYFWQKSWLIQKERPSFI